jgi:hypothetical protein
MGILWIGEVLEKFWSNSSIEMLSPYLFVICIESLFHMISFVDNRMAIHPGRGIPKILRQREIF